MSMYYFYSGKSELHKKWLTFLKVQLSMVQALK